jgi:hypothetical protein
MFQAEAASSRSVSMPVHDWTRVTAGTFHDFHVAWVTHLKEALNGGILPEGFYAMSEQRAGTIIADVLTLQSDRHRDLPSPAGSIALAEAPPKVSRTMVPDEIVGYKLARKTLTIRHTSDHRIVALIEIVSPANKDRPLSVEEFVEKALSALSAGYHLLVLDILPPGPYDAQGIHGEIWREFDAAGYSPPHGKPLTLAAYAARDLPQAYIEPIGVGSELPDMPLFLHPERYVNVPLEKSYGDAFRGMPAYWRGIVEG